MHKDSDELIPDELYYIKYKKNHSLRWDTSKFYHHSYQDKDIIYANQPIMFVSVKKHTRDTLIFEVLNKGRLCVIVDLDGEYDWKPCDD